MRRYVQAAALMPFILVFAGCSGGDMPSVPAAPPAGSVAEVPPTPPDAVPAKPKKGALLEPTAAPGAL